MRESLQRIVSIVRTDILFRFRRTAAVITMLFVSAGVYFIIPEVSSGRTLIQIDNGRVYYTSEAVAIGTGMFCTIFMSLAGFYLISNSFRRDIMTRTGFVVAASPVSSTEYILGKFLGNLLYLSGVLLTCMLSSMVMFLIRGEAALEPLTFMSIYAWLVFPTIAFCSAAALAFEALPLLSGRFGDVLFFFVWALLLGFSGASIDTHGGADWRCAFDVTGIIPIITFFRDHFHTSSLSIGFSSFDTSKTPILLTEMPWSAALIMQRVSTFALPAVLLALARLWFHRYNPTKIKISARHARTSIYGRVNALLKPAARLLEPLRSAGFSRHATLLNAVRSDVFTTLSLSPFVLVAMFVFAIISLTVDSGALHTGVLAAITVAVVIAVADIVTRDYSAGMMNLLFTAPHLKSKYVLWKCASALAIVLCFTFIPLVRLLFESPNAALSLLVGSVLMAGAAVGFGVLTRSQKPFIAIFLMLLYIMLNAKDVPLFDFVGMYGKATFDVHLGYAMAAFVLITGAHLRHRAQLRQ